MWSRVNIDICILKWRKIEKKMSGDEDRCRDRQTDRMTDLRRTEIKEKKMLDRC